MSSRPEHPRHTTGAHRSRSGAPRRSRPQHSERPGPPDPAQHSERRERSAHQDRADRHDSQGGPEGQERSGHSERYDPHLDGLFTYCLSVLCQHDAATAVLGEVLALAERHHGKRPSEAALYRPWLYALARWGCLRRLAEHTGPGAVPDAASDTDRQRELAVLAWPEAAGTTPEQREALELSVRHRLSAEEVAAVLGAEPVATRALLAAASCEVERTRAALAVVEFGRCPDVARLAGDTQMLLGAALRRELVRHVDDCAECRRMAERTTAAGPWPGTAPAVQGALPLVTAPREAVLGALTAALGSRSGRAEGVAGAGASAGAGRAGRGGGANGSPRYDRSGFPVLPTDRAARRRRLRSRALTTTVVATVLAAPVLALWAAYRSAPMTGETDGSPAVTANESDSAALDGRPYENAGNARTTPEPGFSAGAGTPDVSVEVISVDGTPLRPGEPTGARTGPGRLTVSAQPSGHTTVITLSASGGEPVRWRATSGAAWLQMSHTAGELLPGESTTITVYVDHDREPAGHWRAKITIGPGASAVTLEGYGATGPAPGPSHPRPTDPTPPTSDPTPTPTDPTPTPTDPTSPPTEPTPTGTTPTSSPSDTTGSPTS
ncbi:sigma-70 family RNA polymerase sigma factor [Streptomyces sp. NPDC017993]|uniref:BACON domain-containing protein n=1 Tax=Streptomyces sp. NPDC017993 TaxID=3365027 RepID=UPI0037885CD2